jgi:hypothetical protein
MSSKTTRIIALVLAGIIAVGSIIGAISALLG